MASFGNTSHHVVPASTTSLSQKLNLTKRVFVLLTITSFVGAAFAQNDAPSDAATQNSAPPSITIPAGTWIPLVLATSVTSRNVHRGDDIHAQMATPITVGNQVAIPAGSFLQGKVDKLRRKGTRAEIHLQSASIIFPDGYIASRIARHRERRGHGVARRRDWHEDRLRRRSSRRARDRFRNRKRRPHDANRKLRRHDHNHE